MPNNEVGINIRVTENMSSVAPGIANSMKNISSVANDMKEALELGSLEQQYKAFADRVDKLHDQQLHNQQRKNQEDNRSRGGGGGGGGGRGGDGLRYAGNVGGKLGQGEVLGATSDVAGKLQDVIGAAGPIGMVIGTLAGAFLVIDQLSKAYEANMEQVMSLTSQFGKLGATAADTSKTFGNVSHEMAAAGAEFGYGLEKVAPLMDTMSKSGLGYGTALGETRNIFGYARGFGMDEGLLAQYTATGRRFGMGGNIIGAGAGAADQSGLTPGRYNEFFQATLDVFEEGLSRGIVKGFGDIQHTQAWLSQGGEIFRGQTGLHMYKRLESAVTGSTGLGSESDAIMFRAAQRVVERRSGREGKEWSYVDVMKELEQGLSEDLFEEVKGIVGEMTTSTNEQIELFRQLFNVNYSTAERLMGLKGGTGVAAVKAAPSVTDTEEVKLMRAQLNVMEDIRQIGQNLLPTKAGLVSGVSDIMNTAMSMTGQNYSAKQAEEWKTSGGLSRLRGKLGTMGSDAGAGIVSQDVVAQALARGGALGASASQFLSMTEGITPAEAAGLRARNATEFLGKKAYMTQSSGELLPNVASAEDMPVVLAELTKMLGEVRDAIRLDKNVSIYQER